MAACAFLVYTAQAPGCSAGVLSKTDPAFPALLRSKLLRFRFLGSPQRHRLSWACVLCPFQVQAAQATRCLASALSQLGGASYHLPGPRPLVSCVCLKSAISGVLCVSSGELIAGCDPPPGGCQLYRISGRRGKQLGACSQFGGRCSSPLPSSSGCGKSASLPLGREELVHSG